VWVENGGIVGRGVLLDYATWAESQGRTLTPLEDTKIPLSDILAVAESQNVTFRPSDILFIRSGFTKALAQLSPEESNAYATKPAMHGIGVEAGEEMLKWIWEREFAAVAGDMLAFESLPFASQTHWMHEWLLAGWGMPIGELFDLERLSEVCREKGKWEFFFSSVPLKVSDEWKWCELIKLTDGELGTGWGC
jgi:kynurenine formamidase